MICEIYFRYDSLSNMKLINYGLISYSCVLVIFNFYDIPVIYICQDNIFNECIISDTSVSRINL